LSKIKWIIFSIISVGVLALLVIFSNQSKIDVSNVDVNAIQIASDQSGNIADNVSGKADSKVTLIEYADYQCPGCAGVYPTIKSVTEEYADRVAFVFRNFPLTTIHANAKAAAATSEAAGLQGKFWEMHDKVYKGQSSWSNLSESARVEFFANYAKELNLDMDKFNKDIVSSSVSQKISFDLAVGKKAKVDSTPTFFLNGVKLDQSVWADAAKLKEAIDTELSKN
jgi:protein-disulfide isomerase